MMDAHAEAQQEQAQGAHNVNAFIAILANRRRDWTLDGNGRTGRRLGPVSRVAYL